MNEEIEALPPTGCVVLDGPSGSKEVRTARGVILGRGATALLASRNARSEIDAGIHPALARDLLAEACCLAVVDSRVKRAHKVHPEGKSYTYEDLGTAVRRLQAFWDEHH